MYWYHPPVADGTTDGEYDCTDYPGALSQPLTQIPYMLILHVVKVPSEGVEKMRMQSLAKRECEGCNNCFQVLILQIQCVSSQVEQADEGDQGRGQSQGRLGETCQEQLVHVAS